MKPNIDIAQRLKSIRKIRSYTQEQVAAAIGINRPAYQAYEEERAAPPLNIVIRLADFYGFKTIDGLLKGVVENNKQDRLLDAYYSADPEKRKIVDYILKIG